MNWATLARPSAILGNSFFLTILAIPITSLLWPYEIGLIKLNWISLALFPMACLFFVIKTRYYSKSLVIYSLAFGVYGILFVLNNGDFETLMRVFVALLPLLFLDVIRKQVQLVNSRWFWKAYLAIIAVPIVISILQLIGSYPFFDPGEPFWLVESGRISGGYQKPNNLVCYLFPVFIYGIYLIQQKNRLRGIILIGICFLVVFTSAMRTALIAYGLIFIFSFFPTIFIKSIAQFYKYLIPPVVVLVSILMLKFSFNQYGPIDGLRYRLPMWQAQADHFLASGAGRILFGHSVVSLPADYQAYSEIRSFEEAHNNAIRLVITFGLLGFLLYCLLLRKSVLSLQHINDDNQLFRVSSCLFFYITYSITNEPVFYVSIFWSIMFWAFITEP